jgi:hypothetical protein
MVMASAIVMENLILKVFVESINSFWSTDSVGPEVQHFVKKKISTNNPFACLDLRGFVALQYNYVSNFWRSQRVVCL